MRKSSSLGQDIGDEKRAVLRVEKTTYEQLARSVKTWGVLSWADYCAFVEKCIQEGLARGWPVKVYEGSDVGIRAFMHSTGLDFDTRTLLIYAADLDRVERGQESIVHRR